MVLLPEVCSISVQCLYESEARSNQLMLHELNLDFLAKQISENGLSAEFIFCTDEVGVNLQPSEVEKWVKKGTKVVAASTLSEDKRSFTTNIFGNAAGKVIGHHQTFTGRTTQSLPDIDISLKYEEKGFIVLPIWQYQKYGLSKKNPERTFKKP